MKEMWKSFKNKLLNWNKQKENKIYRLYISSCFITNILKKKNKKKLKILKNFAKKENIPLITIIEAIFHANQQVHEINLSKVKSIKEWYVKTEISKKKPERTYLCISFYGKQSDKELCLEVKNGKIQLFFRKITNGGLNITWQNEISCLTMFFYFYYMDIVNTYHTIKIEEGKIKAIFFILKELLAIAEILLKIITLWNFFLKKISKILGFLFTII